MGQLWHLVVRIAGLALRPAHPHLTHESFAFELLLVGEHHALPLLDRPALIALGEGEPLALILCVQLLLVSGHSTEEVGFLQATIDGACGGLELVLALEAARGAELLHMGGASDGGVHRFVGAARPSAAGLITEVFLLLEAPQPVAHSGKGRARLLRYLSARQALLVQHHDCSSLDDRQRPVVPSVRWEQRKRRRGGRGRRSGCCRCMQDLQ